MIQRPEISESLLDGPETSRATPVCIKYALSPISR
jgi:hypothetical protein